MVRWMLWGLGPERMKGGFPGRERVGGPFC